MIDRNDPSWKEKSDWQKCQALREHNMKVAMKTGIVTPQQALLDAWKLKYYQLSPAGAILVVKA